MLKLEMVHQGHFPWSHPYIISKQLAGEASLSGISLYPYHGSLSLGYFSLTLGYVVVVCICGWFGIELDVRPGGARSTSEVEQMALKPDSCCFDFGAGSGTSMQVKR